MGCSWEDALEMADAIYDAGLEDSVLAGEWDLVETIAATSHTEKKRAAAKGGIEERTANISGAKKSRCAAKNARRRARQKRGTRRAGPARSRVPGRAPPPSPLGGA